MREPVFAPLTQASIDWIDNEPQASNFNDCYFARQAGRAESQYVFLHGNHLQERFAKLPANGLFVIGETGFGTGLNFLEAASLFLQTAPADARLVFISCEKFPLSRADLARAHAQWPTHRQLTEALARDYPAASPGFHQLQPHARLSLLLLQGDANQLLPWLDASIDAWFLDGFAPARNPDFWQPSLFAELARLSAPGASLATFTAAGQVRRDLSAAGFSMSHAPGFGHKREMLRGQFAGHWKAQQRRLPRVAIIGAGLAGSSSAHALAEAGCQVQLFDGKGIANGASGNLAGVIYATASANFNTQNRFYQSSFLTAITWLKREQWPRQPAQGCLNGVIQLPAQARLVSKQQKALVSGYWPTEILQPAHDWPSDSIVFPSGGYLNPPAWCQHLVAHPNIHFQPQQITRLARGEHGWLLFAGDDCLCETDAVILANAQAAQDFMAQPLPLKLMRGQVSHVAATPASRNYQQAVSHQGYFAPAINGLHCVGASFDLHDARPQLKAADDADNLAQLKRWLPNVWHELGGDAIKVHSARVELRCQSTDFLPLVGASDTPGLYLNIAHGSRGLSSTPLCADLIASQLTGTPCPVDRAMMAALHPGRFAARAVRKRQ